MHIRTFRRADEPAVIRLWQACGLTRPWNDPHRDIERKLSTQPELFFVGLVATELMASAMAGFDGHRGWLYYLAVSPAYQNRAYGRQLVSTVEGALVERGCPKLNLQVRASNPDVVAFYEKLGYRPDDVVSLGRRLIVDDDAS